MAAFIKNESQFTKRLKAFGWSTGMMVVALAVDFSIQNLGEFNMPDSLTVILGLVLAQVSKYLNSQRVV